VTPIWRSFRWSRLRRRRDAPARRPARARSRSYRAKSSRSISSPGTNPATIQTCSTRVRANAAARPHARAAGEEGAGAAEHAPVGARQREPRQRDADRSFTNLSRALDSADVDAAGRARRRQREPQRRNGQLDATVRRNAGHFDAIVAALDASSRRPQPHGRSGRRAIPPTAAARQHPPDDAGIAQTATTSPRSPTIPQRQRNPQTQAQLRDTVANVDAASQKANSLLARFGGRSASTASTAARRRRRSAHQSPGGPPVAARRTRRRRNAAAWRVQSNVKNKVSDLVRSLIALQIRVSELVSSAPARSGSPLLTATADPRP